MAQLMPLPLTVSCFSKIQNGITFLVLAHPGNPGQRAFKRVYGYFYGEGGAEKGKGVRGGELERDGVDIAWPEL